MFRWLFGNRKDNHDPDDKISEVWESHFGPFSDRRFPLESGDGYALTQADRGLTLKLSRPLLFAWVTDPFYVYDDFVLEADLELPPGQDYGAFGFLFRQADELNYYMLLVSTKGQFRLDVVFNGRPRSLLPWTSFPEAWEGKGHLTLIARGDRFLLTLDGLWIAEAWDEEIPSGRIALCAQTYEATTLEGRLRRIRLDSRPIEVETEYARWTEALHADPAQRLVLAESLAAIGSWAEAAHQIVEAAQYADPGKEATFLLAQCMTRLGNPNEALRVLEQTLNRNPDWELALKEKGNLLYTQNRFLELKEFVLGLSDPLPDDEYWWNLLGHAYFHLGSWEKAVEAYGRAWDLNPGMVLYRLNKARAEEKTNRDQAVEDYLAAATLLFHQEAWEDLERILWSLEKMIPGEPGMLALKAKVLYSQEKKTEARELLEQVLSTGYSDASSAYLLGLLKKEAGDLEGALPLLETAARLEPDYGLFQFRLGEVKFLGGLDGSAEAWKALTLEPQNPWVWNLWGQIQESLDEKEKAFLKAQALAPQEVDIALNLAQVKLDQGQKEEGWSLAESFLPDPRVSNWQGNVLCAEGFWQQALDAYDKALAADPKNPVYLENSLVPLWKLEMYSRLEDTLIDLLEEDEAPRFLIQMGDLASLRGEIPRAEVAYWAAADKGSVEALEALAGHFATLGRLHRLPGIIELLKKTGSTQVERWENFHRDKTMESFSCASCGRVWWVPRNLGDQGVLRLSGEPPEDAPAGKSPGTGKVYCIGCAQHHMKENRFVCPDTGENLKLNDDRLKWVLRDILSRVPE